MVPFNSRNLSTVDSYNLDKHQGALLALSLLPDIGRARFAPLVTDQTYTLGRGGGGKVGELNFAVGLDCQLILTVKFTVSSNVLTVKRASSLHEIWLKHNSQQRSFKV